MDKETRYNKEKAKVTKRIQRLLIVCMALAIPVFIGCYICSSSFIVIIPPDKYDTYPDGAMLWSYWPDRHERLITPDFIQELDLQTLILLVYIKIQKDRSPLQFPYIRRLHEIVSGDIGSVEKELNEPDNKSIEPGIKKLDNLGVFTLCSNS